ncbi:hypothetical protein N9K77_00855 [bacterium]|nr:hypothetical protein [bacterium]
MVTISPINLAINFHIPQRGDKKALLLLSKKNALAKKIEFLKTEAIKNPDFKGVKPLLTNSSVSRY